MRRSRAPDLWRAKRAARACPSERPQSDRTTVMQSHICDGRLDERILLVLPPEIRTCQFNTVA
jgi:hypothetical protein